MWYDTHVCFLLLRKPVIIWGLGDAWNILQEYVGTLLRCRNWEYMIDGLRASLPGIRRDGQSGFPALRQGYIYVYIYIYIQREREREREIDLSHSQLQQNDKRVCALCSEMVEKNVRNAEIEDPSIWGSWLSLTSRSTDALLKEARLQVDREREYDLEVFALWLLYTFLTWQGFQKIIALLHVELMRVLQDSHSRICAKIRFTWIVTVSTVTGCQHFGEGNYIGLRKGTLCQHFLL